MDGNEAEAGESLGECPGDLGAGAERAALQQGIDVALGLRLREAVFGRELRHEVGLAVERGDGGLDVYCWV